MSEEGELKKRLHKAYGILDDGICHEECLPNIDKILDEAKKEFEKALASGKSLTDYETAYANLHVVIVKWFGHE